MQNLLSPLLSYCQQLREEFAIISDTRKAELQRLAEYIQKKKLISQVAKINVICTHNSRRSHLGQLWLQVSADYLQVTDIQTFSGGTEATALNPRVVKALRSIGFRIETEDENAVNPHYQISWSREQQPYIAFSKKYSTAPNPTTDFAAIMVCTEADAGCPIINGADFRLPLPYDDPKAFDDTDMEEEKYLERCRQIGREMLYVMNQI